MAVAYKDPLEALENAKKLASSGDVDGAAKLLASYGMSEEQARKNLQSGLQQAVASSPTTPTQPATNTTNNQQVSATSTTNNSTVPHGTPVNNTPPTSALPSQSGMGQQLLNNQMPQIDYDGIMARASREASSQINNLRRQAQTNASRYQSEGQAQIAALREMYGRQYAQNEEDTEMGARSALMRQAARGFSTGGMTMDAELRARLAGEDARMNLAAQETGQVGEINSRILQSQRELQDMLQSLAGQENDLMQQLADRYTDQERGFGLQQAGLNSSNILALMGMDQGYNQFMQGMQWDKDKFAQQLNWDQTQFQGTQQMEQARLAEAIASRQAQNGLANRELDLRNSWQQSDDTFRRDQMTQQGSQFDRELGMRDKWWQGDNDLAGRQLAEAIAARQSRDAMQGSSNDLGWAQLLYQKQRDDADRTLDERGLNLAQKNSTANWMNHYETLRARAQAGDPDALTSLGLQAGGQASINDYLSYYQSRNPLISSEGADYEALVDYIYRRYGLQRPNPTSPGPVNQNPMQYFQRPFSGR